MLRIDEKRRGIAPIQRSLRSYAPVVISISSLLISGFSLYYNSVEVRYGLKVRIKNEIPYTITADHINPKFGYHNAVFSLVNTGNRPVAVQSIKLTLLVLQENDPKSYPQMGHACRGVQIGLGDSGKVRHVDFVDNELKPFVVKAGDIEVKVLDFSAVPYMDLSDYKQGTLTLAHCLDIQFVTEGDVTGYNIVFRPIHFLGFPQRDEFETGFDWIQEQGDEVITVLGGSDESLLTRIKKMMSLNKRSERSPD